MKKTRRALVASSLLGAVIFGTAGVAGAELIKVDIPAPVAKAEGLAANVGGIVGIGHTQSDAAPSAGNAVANAVEIGGVAPLAVLGSTQNGPGETTNALLDTQQTPLGRVEVAPSAAKVTEAAGVTQSESNAALGRGNLFNPDFASIAVLESTSTATHSGMLSRAFSTSDALVLNLGGPDGTTIRLLHSESSSAGTGLTYIIAINDQPIISVTELTDQVCALALPEVLRVSCLEVTGGVGAMTSEVLNATVGGPNGLTANVVKASGSGGAGATQTLSGPAAADEVRGVAVVAPDTGSNALPRTGVHALFLASVAFAFVALGTVLVGMRRTTTR